MDENPRISDLRKKIDKDPGSRLFAQLAEELRKEGRLEEAIQVAYDGLAKHPAYPSARLTLARALLDSGRASEARPELEQIVKAAPDNILAGRLLGDALDALGDLPAALKQFERTLMFSPGDKAMVAHVADLKARMAAPSPVAAAAPTAVAETAPAFDQAAPTLSMADPAPLPAFESEPATALPSFADASSPAPSPFGDASDAPPSIFGDAAETSAPALFSEEASVGGEVPPTLEMPSLGATTMPAVAIEDETEAATLPFALSDGSPTVPPPDFSESSAALPAFQFEEPSPATPGPQPAIPEAVATRTPEPEAPLPPPPPPAPAPAPPAPAFSLALDRDLASGTISPGAFNMAELQRHFEAIAAAERAAAAGNAAPPSPPSPPPVPAPPAAAAAASALAFRKAPEPVETMPPAPEPVTARTQPAAGHGSEAASEEAFTFNSGEFETPNMDTADTVSIAVPDGGFDFSPEAEPEPQPFSPSAAASPDPDLASQTLPLTSLTLADLYLQQGLKAEAAAVLSQVVREEPANEQARSKLADVSAAVGQSLSEPAEHFADEGSGPEEPVAPPSRPRTRGEISEAAIAGLRAFQGAVEREALAQKATEIRVR